MAKNSQNVSPQRTTQCYFKRYKQIYTDKYKVYLESKRHQVFACINQTEYLMY